MQASERRLPAYRRPEGSGRSRRRPGGSLRCAGESTSAEVRLIASIVATVQRRTTEPSRARAERRADTEEEDQRAAKDPRRLIEPAEDGTEEQTRQAGAARRVARFEHGEQRRGRDAAERGQPADPQRQHEQAREPQQRHPFNYRGRTRTINSASSHGCAFTRPTPQPRDRASDRFHPRDVRSRFRSSDDVHVGGRSRRRAVLRGDALRPARSAAPGGRSLRVVERPRARHCCTPPGPLPAPSRARRS